MKIFNLFRKMAPAPVEPTVVEPEVVESILGNFSYHLRYPGQKAAICGKEGLMQTSIPLSGWGYISGHIGEKYCKECAKGIIEVVNE
jgi:hypothetical protein